MNIAIILSGGVGSRMGLGIPKQYVEVNGKPILDFCMQTFLLHENIDSIVIVVAPEWKDYVIKNLAKTKPSKPIFYAIPGETRQYSILNALKVAKEKCESDNDIVIIHDGARPLVSDELISRCINACQTCDGVMPVIPVKDTTYLSKDGKHIEALLDRNTLWSGQAPEAFKIGKYWKAYESLSHNDLLKINGSTELAFKAGLQCRMIEGDPMNFKITTPEDLINFERIISQLQQ